MPALSGGSERQLDEPRRLSPGDCMTRIRDRMELPEGFRWLRREDIGTPFKTLDKSMDQFPLEAYYEWSLDDDALVIVRERSGQLAAIVCARARQDHLMIEMVGRNKLLGLPGVGAELVALLETHIAPKLGIHEVRLEARPGLVPYYDDVLGYEEYDAEVEDKGWPEKLTPKRKRV